MKPAAEDQRRALGTRMRIKRDLSGDHRPYLQASGPSLLRSLLLLGELRGDGIFFPWAQSGSDANTLVSMGVEAVTVLLYTLFEPWTSALNTWGSKDPERGTHVSWCVG